MKKLAVAWRMPRVFWTVDAKSITRTQNAFAVIATKKSKALMETNNLRFVRQEHYTELVNLYHLARTALAGGDDSKWARMIWASKEFSKLHPYVSSTGAYKDLSENLQGC